MMEKCMKYGPSSQQPREQRTATGENKKLYAKFLMLKKKKKKNHNVFDSRLLFMHAKLSSPRSCPEAQSETQITVF